MGYITKWAILPNGLYYQISIRLYDQLAYTQWAILNYGLLNLMDYFTNALHYLIGLYYLMGLNNLWAILSHGFYNQIC